MIVETLICLHLLNLAAYSIHLTSSHFKLDFLFLICFYILSSYFLCWIVPAFVLALFENLTRLASDVMATHMFSI